MSIKMRKPMETIKIIRACYMFQDSKAIPPAIDVDSEMGQYVISTQEQCYAWVIASFPHLMSLLYAQIHLKI